MSKRKYYHRVSHILVYKFIKTKFYEKETIDTVGKKAKERGRKVIKYALIGDKML